MLRDPLCPTSLDAGEDVAEFDQDEFKIWFSKQNGPGHFDSSGAVLKAGPRVCKTVTVSRWGNTETGELRRLVLELRTSPKGHPGYDFDHPTAKWYCENEEV